MAFNAQPEDLLSDSEHKDIVLHFALQRGQVVFSRVSVDVEDFGLLAGSLIALAHMAAVMEVDSAQMPAGVATWLRYAWEIHAALALDSSQPEDVDIAMEEVGGHLGAMRISQPRVVIEVMQDMTSLDQVTAWKFAKAKLLQVHKGDEKYRRGWDKWLNYDQQVRFYLLMEEERLAASRGAIYRAMERYDEWLVSQGNPSISGITMSGSATRRKCY